MMVELVNARLARVTTERMVARKFEVARLRTTKAARRALGECCHEHP
jgi:hypothetical protein